MTTKEARDLFPALSDTVYGKPLIYFDNAATSQRPNSVLDKMKELSLHANANIHRAVHNLSSVATEEYESTRDCIRDFINAKEREEIVFTSGTTASINLLAYSFAEAFIGKGDEIIICESEHHSNIVPWQIICDRKSATIKVLPVDEKGIIEINKLESLISDKTKLLAVAQISNVLGVINPIRKIVKIAHAHNVPVLVDGAQGVVHLGMDVQNTDVDFYAFSGHKMYASTGTGVLYGKRKYLEAMPPFMGGGEMISSVKFAGTSYAPLPEKFEAGTQNFNGVPTFKEAVSLWKQLNGKQISEQYEAAKEYLWDYFTNKPEIRLIGQPSDLQNKIALFSFVVDGVHHEDLALILDKMGIASRSGQMCAEPLMDRFGVTGMLRISLAPYNTTEEAEFFVKSLEKAITMLR